MTDEGYRRAVMLRFGELFLKSESVRRYYMKVLKRNLSAALEGVSEDWCITLHRERILIEGSNPERIAEISRRTFGVVDVSICLLTPPEREVIEEAAAELASNILRPGMSFAVRARRSGMKGFSSQEMAASIGSRILSRIPGLSVSLSSPDAEIFAEARSFGGIVYSERLSGPGGIPLGTQGEVLCLLSAGIDSPVAAWLAMRRGCRISFLHCNGEEYLGKDVFSNVLAHCAELSLWCRGERVEMISASITPFFNALIQSGVTKNRCILCKRFMFRLAAEIAEMRGRDALVTGDSIGQVASQTLKNLRICEAAVSSSIPLLRPLITYDKEETIAIARSIGTFRESPGELGCTVVPKHPAIQAVEADILEEERLIDTENLISEIMEGLQIYRAYNGSVEEITQPKARSPAQSP